MQFEFKEEDILRLANEIDNRAEYPEVYPDPIVVKFSGDFASFSRPEFRVEKMTYKVPTFSALRNMLQAIYWHPGFNYVPVFCGVRKPIRYEYIATNGIKGVPKVNPNKPIILRRAGDSLQRTTQYLLDVEYYVIAYLVSLPNFWDPNNRFASIGKWPMTALKKGSAFLSRRSGPANAPLSLRLFLIRNGGRMNFSSIEVKTWN